MFRLEKVFQHDDLFFINSSIISKSLFIFLSVYIFSILEFNSIFDLFNYDIYKNSKYYYLSIYFSLLYFVISFVFKTNHKRYSEDHLFSLINDILPLLITIPICALIFYIFKINFNININTSYLLILFLCNLYIHKKLMNFLYNNLIEQNIIQRNIMLVGSIESIKKILNEKKDVINIYKCCLIYFEDEKDLVKVRQEIKIPIFTQNADVRSILEYHALGQIWILDDKSDKENKEFVNYYIKHVLKFSVDIIILNLQLKSKPNTKFLINKKYEYSNYEISKFYGVNLFTKILLDKILSIFFLLLLSPIFILSMLFIYLEDGFPLFFTQDRTGWDGRRFKIFKLRSLKKEKFDKTIQVQAGDNRVLKIGRIIRRLSIDELPQFFNVLIGDMSIVGPRPHMVEHDIYYSHLFKSFLKRHKTSPGLTGWAQVNGLRGATPTPNLMKERMEHDLWYTNNWSIWLDLFIIIKTFYIIFRRPGR